MNNMTMTDAIICEKWSFFVPDEEIKNEVLKILPMATVYVDNRVDQRKIIAVQKEMLDPNNMWKKLKLEAEVDE